MKINSRPKSSCSCADDAHELYELYEKSNQGFPAFWSLIGRDKDKLAGIFVFFCRTLEIQETEGTIQVQELLGKKLVARWSGEEIEVSSKLKTNIERLSTLLVRAFKQLNEQQLVGPAFELFASGALAAKRMQYPLPSDSRQKAQIDSTDFWEPEPDSGGFFYWAEFALLSASLGFDSEYWKSVLPVMLKSERIFALCYGKPEKGSIPPSRKYRDYNRVKHTPLHPKQAQGIMVTSSTSLAKLEAAQTECAKFAFPGEDWS